MIPAQAETGALEEKRREKRPGFYRLSKHFSLGWFSGGVLRLSNLK